MSENEIKKKIPTVKVRQTENLPINEISVLHDPVLPDLKLLALV